MRSAKIKRKTKETDIEIQLNIDGTGTYSIKTPVNFISHMLESFSKHGLFDLDVKAAGDIKVDQHHTIEDIGIVIGKAFKKALEDRSGISRSGYFVYPMDESLAVCAVDLSGRSYLKFEAEFKRRFCGDFDTDLLEDFFKGFADNCGCSLHILMPYGRNDHHKIEAIFKAFAKAMKMACSRDLRIRGQIPSTKGVI
ncbi:imidazoleglycerol-phosphate dehydratase HisB [Candidatus Woesearchaeota archaeon]|nr:imidazoleglycerol-phosphate dehydratase HisB [Candidatus Woesearchaeota archaeon]